MGKSSLLEPFTMNSFFVDLLRGEVYGFEFIHLQDLPSVKYLHSNDFLFTILLTQFLRVLVSGSFFDLKVLPQVLILLQR